MAGLELLVTLLLALLIIVVIFFGRLGYFSGARGTKKLLNIPPGRLSRLPLIGEAFSFYKPHYPPSMSKFLEQRVQRYGSIFKINLFGEPTIISLDRDFNKFVLQNETNAFLTSFPKSMVNILGKSSLGFQTGVLHQTMRSSINKIFNGLLRTYLLPIDDREASLILDSWDKYSSFSAVKECKKVRVYKQQLTTLLTLFTFDMMMKYVLNMGMSDEELKKLRGEYDTLLRGFFAFPINIQGTAYGRALQARSFILKVLKRKLEVLNQDVRKDENEEARKGLASVLAREADLTMDQILNTLMGVLFAGYTTSADALVLAMYFLRSCPNALQQLREEHIAIVNAKRRKGERTLTWLDYKQMEFTHCVTNETLRLGNIVTMLFRRAIRDVHYKDFDIPCGWKVITFISSSHLDPSSFEDPLTFNPWRWKATSTSINNKNMMPFGCGPRLCPGSEFSKVETAIFLHHLVQRYDWEYTMEDVPMFFPYIHFPKGFPIKVFPITNANDKDAFF